MTVTPVAATGTITSAIALASSRTGIDFDYLMGQARVESGLNANAAAPTSSARGLYQFIEQSWLAVVKKHGAEHGMGWAAESIQQNSSGRYTIADPAMRRAVLNLRSDPTAASLMAAEHASDNKAALENTLGRDATGTDLYMAHFLGLGGAKGFLRAMARNPEQSGAALFPAAAGANRNIFFGRDGSQRSLSEIYARFSSKLGLGGEAMPAVASAPAAAPKNAIAELMSIAGAEVVAGAGETDQQATRWAQATLDRLNGRQSGAGGTLAQQLLRPTPDTARLAYMMLAQMGGN